MKPPRLSTALLAGAAALAAGCSALASGSSETADTDSATAPIPEYDYDDPGKSFIVNLDFDETSARTVDAFVGPQRAYSHLGDPPLLELRLRDENGTLVRTLNAWDPRWTFEETPSGGERLIVLPGPGTIVVEFDADIGSMVVHDLRADRTLVTVDLRPAVREFCLANPDDPQCVEADLAVTGTTASGALLSAVGEANPLHLATTVANLGPDGPVDAVVRQTVTASPGVTVSPTERTLEARGLEVDGPVDVTGDYEVTCTEPGLRTLTVDSTIEPERAKVADTDDSNNTDSATVDVNCAVPVTVNIQPGSAANPVNRRSTSIPLAVLTTDAGEYGNPLAFDATTIQASTVGIGHGSELVADNTGVPERHGRIHPADVEEPDELTTDGDLDAMLHANGRDIPVSTSTTELCVRGRFGDGAGLGFFGCDVIRIVP